MKGLTAGSGIPVATEATHQDEAARWLREASQRAKESARVLGVDFGELLHVCGLRDACIVDDVVPQWGVFTSRGDGTQGGEELLFVVVIDLK